MIDSFIHRSIWISDLHLGTRGCSALKILEFLHKHDAEVIYLVGDIIDGWRLSRRLYWPESHNDIVRKLLKKASRGTRIFYVCGNHDAFLRPYIGNNFGGITIVDEIVHITADGRKMLVLHGDQFDAITQYHNWLAKLGDISYELLLIANQLLMWLRFKLGYKYWSLSAYIKHRVKKAACFISNYEETIAEQCRHRGFEGIICGHIHFADIRMIGDVLYCNTGDWVESCTALVEDFNGELSIIDAHYEVKFNFF